jgi:hypothetical protein
MAVLLLGFAVGCASTKQHVKMPNLTVPIEDAGKARIYVIRPVSIGGAISMGVRDGERAIGNTGPTSYLCWEREPGSTTIYSKAENESKLDLTVEAGKTYYILQRVEVGFMQARTRLELIDEQRGKKLLKSCTAAKTS